SSTDCNSRRRSSTNLLSRLTVDFLKPSFTRSACFPPRRNTSRRTRSRLDETVEKFLYLISYLHLHFDCVGSRIFDLHRALFSRIWVAADRPRALHSVHNSEAKLCRPYQGAKVHRAADGAQQLPDKDF